MNRRQFLETSTASLALATAATGAVDFTTMKKRVGLIGTGWYGKCDLFRLIQVAPVEVVCLCDADAKMLAAAGEMVVQRPRREIFIGSQFPSQRAP